MCPKSLRDGRRGGAELNEVGPHSASEASAELQGCVCAIGDGGARGVGGMPQGSDRSTSAPIRLGGLFWTTKSGRQAGPCYLLCSSTELFPPLFTRV